jgi:hypothetical protein
MTKYFSSKIFFLQNDKKIGPQKITSFRSIYIWDTSVMLFDYNIVRTH